MSRYRPAIIAVIGTVLMALYSALAGDNRIGPDEAIQIGIAAVTAFIVWNTVNTTGWQYAKPIAAAALAVLNGLAAAWTDGISASEWINFIIAALVAAGVLILPTPVTATQHERTTS